MLDMFVLVAESCADTANQSKERFSSSETS